MQAHLSRFVNWAVRVLADADAAAEAEAAAAAAAAASSGGASAAPVPAAPAAASAQAALASSRAQFELVGVYAALANCLKIGNRAELKAWLPLLQPQLSAPPTKNGSTLARKLRVKLAQRLGLLLLPPRVATWRYDRGARSLLANLQLGSAAGAAATDGGRSRGRDGGGGGEGAGGGPARPCGVHSTSEQRNGGEGGVAAAAAAAAAAERKAARGRGGEEEGAPADAPCDTSDDSCSIPEEIEEVLSQLLLGLHDEDTIVRWSAAKGIGRLVARLP